MAGHLPLVLRRLLPEVLLVMAVAAQPQQLIQFPLFTQVVAVAEDIMALLLQLVEVAVLVEVAMAEEVTTLM